MTKSPQKRIYVYTVLSWTLAILALVFRILARIYSYDEEIGYFHEGALFPILHYICLGLIVLLAFSSLIAFRRPSLPESILAGMKKTCVMEKIASSIGALGMLAVSVYTVIFYWSKGTLHPNGFTVFGLVTAILSVFYFLFLCIPSTVGKKLHLFCGFAFVLHLVYILGVSYFELYTPMNNPVKMLVQLTAIAAILYLLADLRFYMDVARPTRYIFSSILFLGFAAVTVFTGGFFNVLTEAHTTLYHIFQLTLFSLFILAAVRLTRMLSLWAQYDRSVDADEITESDTEEFPSEADDHQEKIRDNDPIDEEHDTPSENTDTRQDAEA